MVQEIKSIEEAKKKRIEREQEVKMSSTRTTAFKINPGLSRDAELLSPLEIRRQKFVQRSSRTKNREKDVLSKLAQFKVAIQAPKFQPNPKETDEEKREESKRLMMREEEEQEEQRKKTSKEDEEARKKQQKDEEIQRKKELYIKLRTEEKQAKKERLEALEKEEQEKEQEARDKDRRRGKKDGDKKTLFPETSGGIEIMPSSLLSDEEEDDDGDEGWMTHKVKFLHRPQDIKKDLENFEKDYSVFDPRDKNAKPDRVVKAKQGQDRLIGFDKQRHSAYQEALQDELQPLDNVDLDRLVEEGMAKRKARAAGKPEPQSSSSTQVSFGAGIYKQALKADKFSFFRDRDTEPTDEAETFKKFGGKKSNFTDSAKPQTDHTEKSKPGPSPTDKRSVSPPRRRNHSRSRSRGKGSRRSRSKSRHSRSRSKEPKMGLSKERKRSRSLSREKKKRSRSKEKKRSRSRDHKKHHK